MRSRYLIAVGSLMALIGLVLIPLPGPGFLIVSLGLLVLLVGLVLSAATWLSRRRQSR